MNGNVPLSLNGKGHRYFVYFIQCGENGPIKIGIAVNVWSRLAALQCGNPVELKVLYYLRVASVTEAYRIEALLHKRYNHRRVSGEWFNVEMGRILWDLDFASRIGPFLEGAEIYEGNEEPEEIISEPQQPAAPSPLNPFTHLPRKPALTPLYRGKLPGMRTKEAIAQSATPESGTERKESNDGT